MSWKFDVVLGLDFESPPYSSSMSFGSFLISYKSLFCSTLMKLL